MDRKRKASKGQAPKEPKEEKKTRVRKPANYLVYTSTLEGLPEKVVTAKPTVGQARKFVQSLKGSPMFAGILLGVYRIVLRGLYRDGEEVSPQTTNTKGE